ncbi:DNase I-like protein [Martensiomyces pterosporus]|nr:DNase I-like protein [Martensiomyces pterosporus]
MCFVCSHLAHDAAQLDKRNGQFHDLCKRLQFTYHEGVPVADPLVPQGTELVGSGQAVGSGRPLTIFDHSYLLWFGDLNYRLAIDTGDVNEYVARGDYEALLGLDQLRIAMLNKQAFAGFEEADIKFAPTYKYVIGTSEYDDKRTPAWCDRLLWWTRPGCESGIRSTEYESVDSLDTSDHKPVRSMVTIDVWKVDQERRQAVFLEVLRELDRYENECIPIATLGSAVVDFGDVYFGKLVQRKMDLTNSGQVPLEYSFIATPSRDHFAPPWLKISPESGMLLPGGQVDIVFSILVDERVSAPLSTHTEELNDILILHLNRGRDYFIQVQGEYRPSVYGMSMDILVHCKEAVRSMSREDFEQCLHSGQFSVPRCIWALTDFLSKYGIDRGYSLFYYKGSPALAETVKECLDTDAPLNPDTILQWQGAHDDHVPRTAVNEPGQILIRGTAGERAAVGRQAGALMSMTDQTLVSSTLQSALSHIAISPMPSTTEALERLSLGPWNTARTDPAANPANGGHGTTAEALGEGDNSRMSMSDSDSIPADQGGGNTLLLASNPGGLAGSPLPEAISSAALAAPHDVGVDTVASCLVDLFSSLPEPLISADLYNACIEAGGISRAAALEAVEVLPPGSFNVILYLLAFLRVAVESGATSTQCIAHVFAKVLLRPPPGRDPAEGDAERAEAFLSFLLRSHGDI